MPAFAFLYPISEVFAWYLFVDRYSFGDAVLLCISTGLVGLAVVAMQGQALIVELGEFQKHAMAGKPLQKLPKKAFHRLSIVFGGLFLFIPGLLAKIVGTALILPLSRHFILWILSGYFADKFVFRGVSFFMNNVPRGARDVIEIRPQSIEHQTIGDDPDRH